MNQMPPITKNLLIINVIFFLASLVAPKYGVDLTEVLGLHYFMASDFHLYQLVTYMFMHADVLHLLFNMLWLYWFGQLFLYLFSEKHFRGVYLLGGLCGAALYILAYNVFPYFSASVQGALLIGASASVLAIAVATAVLQCRDPKISRQKSSPMSLSLDSASA